MNITLQQQRQKPSLSTERYTGNATVTPQAMNKLCWTIKVHTAPLTIETLSLIHTCILQTREAKKGNFCNANNSFTLKY